MEIPDLETYMKDLKKENASMKLSAKASELASVLSFVAHKYADCEKVQTTDKGLQLIAHALWDIESALAILEALVE